MDGAAAARQAVRGAPRGLLEDVASNPTTSMSRRSRKAEVWGEFGEVWQHGGSKDDLVHAARRELRRRERRQPAGREGSWKGVAAVVGLIVLLAAASSSARADQEEADGRRV